MNSIVRSMRNNYEFHRRRRKAKARARFDTRERPATTVEGYNRLLDCHHASYARAMPDLGKDGIAAILYRAMIGKK